jgi:hypothetical protein
MDNVKLSVVHKWLMGKLGVPFLNYGTPKIAVALVKTINKLSDETKTALCYALTKRWIANTLNTDPTGDKPTPLVDLLVSLECERDDAIELIGTFLGALYDEISVTPPN